MKPIDTSKLTAASLELTTISSSYKMLHFDDFPILFLGVNKFGNKILGSHLEEDDESKTILTIHSIVQRNIKGKFNQIFSGKEFWWKSFKCVQFRI